MQPAYFLWSGGINFTPFVLFLPYAKKNDYKFSLIDMGQLKNVCLSVCLSSVCLSVVRLSVCDEFVPNYLLNRWSDWREIFFTKTKENMFLHFYSLQKLKIAN